MLSVSATVVGVAFHSWLLGAMIALPASAAACWLIWQHRMDLIRWTKKHPWTTRFLLTGVQFVIMTLGLLIGYNLLQLEIELPFFLYGIFGLATIVGVNLVPFFRDKQQLVLPFQLRRRRWGYLLLGSSLAGMMAMIGNQLESQRPENFVTRAVVSIDQQMFPPLSEVEEGKETIGSTNRWIIPAAQGSDQLQPSARELKKAARRKRRRERKAFLAMGIAGLGATLFWLAIATCLGVTIALGGLVLIGAAIGGGIYSGAILAGLGGVVVTGLGYLITKASVRAIRRTGPPEDNL